MKKYMNAQMIYAFQKYFTKKKKGNLYLNEVCIMLHPLTSAVFQNSRLV